MERRKFLAAAGTTLGAGFAGCMSGAGVPGSGNGGDDTGEGPGDGDSGTPIVDAEIETTNSDCGGPDDDNVDVDFEEDTVTVDGVLQAPNPCHVVVLEDATVDGEQLSLVVDVEDDLDEDENCIQCHGKIEYRATVKLEEDAEIDEAQIDHVTGGTHGVAQASDSEQDELEVVDSDIETVEAGCGSDRWADATTEDDVAIVEGALTAGNPCHEAVLSKVEIDGTELHATIDVESTSEDDEVCIECEGQIEYEATIELTDASALESASVDHVGGGSYGIAWENVSEGPDEG